jgi:RHS repeat-associated protein
VIGRASYGAYGEVVQKDAALTTSFLFNGQYGVQTDDNGLLYMRARYYSPLIKRFINQDSLLGSIDSSASLNRFAYANGDPASLIDPFGLCAEKAGDGKGFFGSLLDTLLNVQVIKDSFWLYNNADDWREKTIGAIAVPILAIDALSNLIPVIGEEKAALETTAKVAIKKVIEHEAADVTMSVVAKSAPGEAALFEDLVAAAQKAFPDKAGRTELHHITPKYLGGNPKGPLAPLDAAYHQQITNAFRRRAPYNKPKPSSEDLQQIMKDIYSQYPLPPGH